LHHQIKTSSESRSGARHRQIHPCSATRRSKTNNRLWHAMLCEEVSGQSHTNRMTASCYHTMKITEASIASAISSKKLELLHHQIKTAPNRGRHKIARHRQIRLCSAMNDGIQLIPNRPLCCLSCTCGIRALTGHTRLPLLHTCGRRALQSQLKESRLTTDCGMPCYARRLVGNPTPTT